jgi:hypothetical protein
VTKLSSKKKTYRAKQIPWNSGPYFETKISQFFVTFLKKENICKLLEKKYKFSVLSRKDKLSVF